MGISYPGLRFVAMGSGVLLTGLLGYTNVHKLLQIGLDWSNPAVLLAGAAAGGAAIASALAAYALTQRWFVYAGLLLLAIVPLHSADWYNSLEGLLIGREVRVQSIRDHNAAVDLATQAKIAADAEVTRLQGEVTKETLNKGCKSICKALQVQLVVAEAKVQTAASEVLRLGVKRSEENIVAKNLGVSEVIAETLPSLMTVSSVLALSILCLCFGHGKKEQVAAEPVQHGSVDATDGAEKAFVGRVVAALLANGGAVDSNDELAALMGVRKGTASKLAQAAEEAGLVVRKRNSREMQIYLAADAGRRVA